MVDEVQRQKQQKPPPKPEEGKGKKKILRKNSIRKKILDEKLDDSLLAKGGEVKKYMGGGSVHKNKSNMITKRGWGASRKT
jgi:hypothetical protein